MSLILWDLKPMGLKSVSLWLYPIPDIKQQSIYIIVSIYIKTDP